MNLKKYLETSTQTELAEKLGVSQGLVSQWVNGDTAITAEKAIAIEVATEGAVTRSDLRPDLWPDRVSDAA
jgi:DNA-binding transcriptional regulator YdaS (Cro superfamily)